MTDPEIEAALRRYRPAGPAPDLRVRVVMGAEPVGSTWPWAAAAAVLLATIVMLQSSTDAMYRSLQQNRVDSIVPEQLPVLRSAIGDDEMFNQILTSAIERNTEDVTREMVETALVWQ